MANEVKFNEWIHNAHSIFLGPEFYHVDFSRLAGGDFRFKLVASFKILVAMATKMVATWRVGLQFHKQLLPRIIA